MSTMQTGYGRVVDRRVDSARRIGAIARAARRVFDAVNRTPSADMAETIRSRKQAGAAAERTRIDAIVRYGGREW